MLLGRSSAAGLPRWRGFNLQEKFTDKPDEWADVAPEWGRSNEPFLESDFESIAELGFNFARLPMSYRCWTDPADPFRLLEAPLSEIDRAVEWGRQYGVHVCLNFHRAPGFCINAYYSPEPWNLWTDSYARELFAHHWRHFARRYRGVPGADLSFNLVNEPNLCTAQEYADAMAPAIAAIQDEDAGRTLVIDGLFGEATLPVEQLLAVPGAVHSARGYAPFKLTHYLATWAGSPSEPPVWPDPPGAEIEWNREVFERYCVRPWLDFEAKGARVFVGEWGCYNRTPHEVALAWMRDCLELWRDVGWGWALWCFRGSFGILDSGRDDVVYENWKGRQLDRRMLELLREF